MTGANGREPNAAPLTSILIVSYMSAKHLGPCLDSILRQTGSPFEVVLVDNASTDGSADIVERDYPMARLIRSGENLGFAKGNNVGLPYCQGKYILLLNPDTVMTDGSLHALVDCMEKSPDVSAAGCRILYPDGSPQLSCGAFPTMASAVWGGQAVNRLLKKIFPEADFFGACGVVPERLDERLEVDTLLGACVILRRDVIEKTGLFDESMFLYFEECDLFYRIKKAGGKVIYTPDAVVYHYAGGSVICTREAVGYYLDSQERYLIKNFGLKRVQVFRVLVMLSSLIKSALISLAYPFARKADAERQAKKIAWHWSAFLCRLELFFPFIKS
jgi:GT2 family glycosyltransferase